MCSIWKESPTSHLSLQQFEQIFSSNDFSFIRSLTLTGGEPTLRANLAQIFNIIYQHTPNLEHILIATNGLNTSMIVRQVRLILETLDTISNLVYRMDVQISLHGVGEIHDRVTGIPGAFQRVSDTINELGALQINYPLLSLRLNCVLMPCNLSFVDSLVNFSTRQMLPITYTPVILADNYFNNTDNIEDLTFSQKYSQIASCFFEQLSQEEKNSFRFCYRNVAQMIQGHKRTRKCMMGLYNFILECNGDVHFCFNSEEINLGNLLTDSFESVWFGEHTDKARRKLRALHCPTCPAMCYPMPVSIVELLEALRGFR
jgi:MoaA/NifB/PqqE/SkfB family radical SAM enzyme